MLRTIAYQDIDDKCLLLDVRSPGEYQDSTIPGAVSLPLFSDAERKLIGTVYTQESKEKAKRIGIDLVGSKLISFYDKIQEYRKLKKKLVVFCARGGMRSGSLCALFNALNIPLWQLEGGYKAYRQTVCSQLPKLHKKIKYLVLHGYTGTGKTELLYKLAEKGFNILDLEGAANHRGSIFGSLGLGRQNSQKTFESIIYHQLLARKSDFVFVEAESRKIGHACLAGELYESMQDGLHILVEAPLELRAARLVKEYIKTPKSKDEVLELLSRLKVNLGEKKIKLLQQLLRDDKYQEIAYILINDYYDPLYRHKQREYKYDLVVNTADLDECVKGIADWMAKAPLD